MAGEQSSGKKPKDGKTEGGKDVYPSSSKTDPQSIDKKIPEPVPKKAGVDRQGQMVDNRYPPTDPRYLAGGITRKAQDSEQAPAPPEQDPKESAKPKRDQKPQS